MSKRIAGIDFDSHAVTSAPPLRILSFKVSHCGRPIVGHMLLNDRNCANFGLALCLFYVLQELEERPLALLPATAQPAIESRL